MGAFPLLPSQAEDGSTVHLVVEAAMNGREVFPSFQSLGEVRGARIAELPEKIRFTCHDFYIPHSKTVRTWMVHDSCYIFC